MEKPQLRRPRTVAVVGTGMAGLATAHLLHQDSQDRYQVTLLEKRDQISLSAESIEIPTRDENHATVWADVPMRAFAGGFYQNLIRMYDHLDIQYHAQPFLFSFTRLPQRQQPCSTTSCIPGPQMVYASNFHQVPPIPRTLDLLQWFVEAVYAVVCYCWFTFCVFFIAPYDEDLQNETPSETFGHYLRRVRMPQYYVINYLLPLISSVCTCTHQELLCFPASDILDYKRRTHRQQHFVVAAGVQSVQKKLLDGLDVRLGIQLTHVIPKDGGVEIQYLTADGNSSSEQFDLVVLAVSPDVAAYLLPDLTSQLSAIPTTLVETVAHTDQSSIIPMLQATGSSTSKARRSFRGTLSTTMQRIHLLSNENLTEAVHEQANSLLVTTNPLLPLDKSKILRSARFVRVLRSPLSRLLVNSMFQNRQERFSSSSPKSWRSGDKGIYLAGGWCWDGMVLLEGCIVSAMRVAADLGVDVPWDLPKL
ncbi:hypothetical protein N7462_009433 [Penicillium macrosclerotiorum]|uniref:uncharacterized protein n=1 Tax=Penicillium macrosclerotiorum TaxID=303699 RepID=UPI0025477C09|nr:uncharacterized protein N7462_009433 [Penicillium macrosclerotiorum]KAJ5673994.1 hypothetical protein N7462_009433 [Penicillium macrosclerotiorum]